MNKHDNDFVTEGELLLHYVEMGAFDAVKTQLEQFPSNLPHYYEYKYPYAVITCPENSLMYKNRALIIAIEDGDGKDENIKIIKLLLDKTPIIFTDYKRFLSKSKNDKSRELITAKINEQLTVCVVENVLTHKI
jgi:hypothetical protein